ncbi:radical SAM protein [Streptomyces sp. NPDC086182]|jgi:hypothetical protein|uniref:radical SAM protein n=1 Tax=Streptomyces sp. NPDC086182 TaxID=3155058 RepID=UPI0034211102
MHLSEVLRLRAVPAAGICLEVTRRCPLHCAHCFTDSSLESAELPADRLLRFADTLAIGPGPQIVVMSGGEPLMRPGLVTALAERARTAGARTYLLSGAFFATRPTVPAAVLAAVEAVDHFAVSMDAFHEREVPGAAVFALLELLLSRGVSTSVQAVAGHADELIGRLRHEFGDQVPVLVTPLVASGRAAAWHRAAKAPAEQTLAPCAMAAWPVVTSTGAVTACCNEQVVAGAAAPHLQLGSIDLEGWPEIRQRCLTLPLPRALRTFGPGHLAARHSGPPGPGYCATCLRLPADAATGERIAAELDSPFGVLAESLVERSIRDGGALGFARRYGAPAYAELVESGSRNGTSDGPDR